MERLSTVFSADRAVFVSDIDGIRVGEEGRPAHDFRSDDLPRITPASGSRGEDATGGIAEKSRIALSMAAAGTEVVVLNGRRNGRLLEALKGGEPAGTWFRRP
jgi:isopentenyl phosphate kinase